ncbi:hypothetical protein [Sinorhizobium fredii]|uniref:hypothetical protein n=1 Tax=Rhizobium fredii TaxID=380 RepID=UPI0004BCA0D9|nr:hypothetical protein [Sinorhizobium fredii]
MTAVLARIALRYGAGILVAKGILAPELGADLASDPDVLQAVQIGAGILAATISEAWFFFAKRLGWAH